MISSCCSIGSSIKASNYSKNSSELNPNARSKAPSNPSSFKFGWKVSVKISWLFTLLIKYATAQTPRQYAAWRLKTG